MNRKGVTYNVGSVMGGNRRPDYDPQTRYRGDRERRLNFIAPETC